jgi:phosphoesterase RecJ-like protein
MRIAADLLELGVPFSEIYNELQYRHSLTETLLFRTALENMTLTADGRIADSVMSYQNLMEKGGGGQDLDGVVEYLLNIRGVEASALFYEKTPGEIKVSMRSKQMDVSGISAAFGGGGHEFAAGCTLRKAASEARGQILAALSEKLA